MKTMRLVYNNLCTGLELDTEGEYAQHPLESRLLVITCHALSVGEPQQLDTWAGSPVFVCVCVLCVHVCGRVVCGCAGACVCVYVCLCVSTWPFSNF